MNKKHTYSEYIEIPGYRIVEVWCRTGSSQTEGMRWRIYAIGSNLTRALPLNDEWHDSDTFDASHYGFDYDE